MIDINMIENKWLHSPAEDTSTTIVFRPDKYPVKLSRNRTELHFFGNGAVKQAGIAPNDRMNIKEGSWKLLDDGHTIEILDRQGSFSAKLHIVELNAELLIIER